MVREVQQMLEIQEIDRELLDLKAQIGRYPGVWEQTKSRLTAAKTRMDRGKSTLDNHELDRRRIEKSLRDQTELLRRYQMQSNMVKSTKELTALSTKVEGIRMRISSLEREGLAELDREANVKAEKAASEAAYAEVEAEAKAERLRIKGQIAEKRAQLEGLEKRRDAVFVGLPEDMRAMYERILRRHPGTVVVPVRNKSCTGCNFQLLNHEITRLHQGDKIQTCDNCGRILSHDESRTEQPAEHAVG